MADFRDLKKRAAEQKAAAARAAQPTPSSNGTAGNTYAKRALDGELAALALATEGERNHKLNTAAFNLGQLVAAGALEESVVVNSLTAVALRIGLTPTETAKTIASGLGSGRAQPRVIPERTGGESVNVFALAGAPQSAPQPNGHPITQPGGPEALTGESGQPGPPILPVTPDEEARFWDSRAILRHLHDFARARRVSPWAVLGVALARVVTATPHQVFLPPIVGGKASLNLFVGLVGPSGAGKGAAEAVAADALNVGYIVSHNVGSGEGIAHGYKRRVKGGELEWLDDDHAVLFSVPEIDSLAAQGGRQGATLLPQLRSGWTGEQLGFGYADATKRIIVEAHQYRLCLVAGIQPGRAACLLEDADAGTPQRFLWLPATDPDAPDVPPDEPKPIIWERPPLDVGLGGVKVDVCETARTTIVEARLARLRGAGDALDGHALLCQLKAAAALGLLESRVGVTEEDWALADLIARKSAFVRAGIAETLRAQRAAENRAKGEAEATRAVVVEQRVTDAAVQGAIRAVMRKLSRAEPGEWVKRGDLAGACSSRYKRELGSALAELEDRALVESRPDGRGTVYRLSRGQRNT